MIVINSSTRQFSIPGADLVFGVESDSGSERKYFQCPRCVGNNLDIAGSFVRINYRNANGEIDSYLVDDLAVDGDNVTFSWLLTPKVTMYKGQVKFVMCVVGADLKMKWHTTQGTGQVLEGLEPDIAVEAETADVVAQLITMVEAQTDAVEAEGDKQIKAVQTAAKTAETASVAEIEAKGVNTLGSIPDDYTALSEAVETLNHTRGAAIVCEAAGSAVAVNDASDLPMQGLRIFGKSTQDGTPTPDAPVEIKSVEHPVVSAFGKNLLPYPYFENVVTKADGSSFVVNPDGGIVCSGTPTGYTGMKVYEGVNLWSGVVTVSLIGTFGNVSGEIALRDASGNTLLTQTFTSYRTVNFDVYPLCATVTVTIKRQTANAEMTGTVYPVMVIGDSVAQKYSRGENLQIVNLTHTLPGIPVTSGGNYTDSDGQQWICDEVDLERGVYVRRIHRIVCDGVTESWGTTTDGVSYIAPFTAYPRDAVQSGSFSYSSHLTYGSYIEGGYWFGKAISVQDTAHGTGTDTKDQWLAWLAEQYAAGTPLVFMYILATPIETTLSETEIAAYRALHTNYPNTTILNDSGAHMVVKYAADTKLYIDNKIAALVGG